VIVPLAQQTGATSPEREILSRWGWVEPRVWTARMLTTLEQGVEGGTWFRLFDKVFSERNLAAGLQQVAKNKGAPGVDHVTVTAFEQQFPEAIWALSDQLKAGTYRPQAIRRVHIPKPGTTETRPLGIPTVRDRIVQAAVVNVIEPIFERDFAEQSYGFRPGRGCQEALRRVHELLFQGHVHVVDVDLKGYFDSIPHDRLMERLQDKIADGPVLRLIESFLKADILDEASRWTPEAGAPQGAVLSPLLSNVYLDPLDHLVARSGFEMVRYADDFVILCRTAEEAHTALELVRCWVSEHGLTLHPTKTRIVDSRTEGFDFLGYHYCHWNRRPRDKSVQKLKDALRPKTKRNSGYSLGRIITDVNRTLRGWYAYFWHGTTPLYTQLDIWLRQRLRALLRRRTKRRGRANGADQVRWPNAYFVEHGLFSLQSIHVSTRQSSRR
jgi:RNA-directed DNA polymerase